MTLPFSIILSLSIAQYNTMEAGHFRAELNCHFWEKNDECLQNMKSHAHEFLKATDF